MISHKSFNLIKEYISIRANTKEQIEFTTLSASQLPDCYFYSPPDSETHRKDSKNSHILSDFSGN